MRVWIMGDVNRFFFGAMDREIQSMPGARTDAKAAWGKLGVGIVSQMRTLPSTLYSLEMPMITTLLS